MASKIKSWWEHVTGVSTFLSLGKTLLPYALKYFVTRLHIQISLSPAHPLNGRLRDSNLRSVESQFGNTVVLKLLF